MTEGKGLKLLRIEEEDDNRYLLFEVKVCEEDVEYMFQMSQCLGLSALRALECYKNRILELQPLPCGTGLPEDELKALADEHFLFEDTWARNHGVEYLAQSRIRSAYRHAIRSLGFWEAYQEWINEGQ